MTRLKAATEDVLDRIFAIAPLAYLRGYDRDTARESMRREVEVALASFVVFPEWDEDR